eukprot:GHVP01040912.1.p1 GENE.GHVP01040912.1~~GHVP01040912.1.p1  ORF type:complete len:127 (-),score=7.82 GHVP01040912.1:1709-2089(-)
MPSPLTLLQGNKQTLRRNGQFGIKNRLQSFRHDHYSFNVNSKLSRVGWLVGRWSSLRLAWTFTTLLQKAWCTLIVCLTSQTDTAKLEPDLPTALEVKTDTSLEQDIPSKVSFEDCGFESYRHPSSL